MRMDEILTEHERRLEEEREKREREPYKEIIRRLRNRDRKKARLEQSPTDGKS